MQVMDRKSWWVLILKFTFLRLLSAGKKEEKKKKSHIFSVMALNL